MEITIQILTPEVPNFIRTADDRTIPIKDFTSLQLAKIGREWTAALIQKAEVRRKLTAK